jgi:heat shock protein HtpX
MAYFRTGLLIAALTALFVGVGYLIGGRNGMVVAFLIAAAMNVAALWFSDKMILRLYNAQEVDRRTAPEFYGIVEDLARRAGLPMPRVYLIENDQPNAFATGRSPSHAAVAATTGLLNMMSREEIVGVMAHELAHVKNRDMLIMTITATIAGAISMLGQMLMFSNLFGGNRDGESQNSSPLNLVGTIVVMILAPLAAMLVQMAVSRTREYAADREGAAIAGNPLWLSSALRRLQHAAERIPNPAAERAPATAHLFIVNPLSGRGMDNLFSTHPNMENRIAALEELAGRMGGSAACRSRVPAAGGARPRTRGPWDS